MLQQIFDEISCRHSKQRFTLRHTLAAISDRRYADPHIGAKADCQPIAQQKALYKHNVSNAAIGYVFLSPHYSTGLRWRECGKLVDV